MNLYLNPNDKIRRYITDSMFHIHMLSYKNGGMSKDELLKELDDCIHEDFITFVQKDKNRYVFHVFDEDTMHYFDEYFSLQDVKFMLVIGSDRERFKRWYIKNIIDRVKVKRKR